MSDSRRDCDRLLSSARQNTLRILHLSIRDGLSTVFPAQVIKPMSLLHDLGWHPRLLLMVPLGQFIRPTLRAAWKQRIKEITAVSPLPLNRLIAPPSRFRSFWLDCLFFVSWILRNVGRSRTGVVVHCRGFEAARTALVARRYVPSLRVLFDCRGLGARESAYQLGFKRLEDIPGKQGERLRNMERAERETATSADWLICVSEAMKTYMCEQWGVASGKVAVVPCCTDTGAAQRASAARNAVRSELKVNDSYVALYCGSLDRWQVPDLWLEWFKLLAALQSNAHLLVITSQPARMEKLAEAAGIPARNRTVLCVPQSRVAHYLSAADCGLLVREPSLINEVAAPVKFAEYLAAGLPVLISEGVGDYSRAVRTHRLGVVLPADANSLEARRNLRGFLTATQEHEKFEMAERCRRHARLYLDWSEGVDRIEAVYKRLVHGAQCGADGDCL